MVVPFLTCACAVATMLTLKPAFIAVTLLMLAQRVVSAGNAYNVHSSVIFTRSGEHTPLAGELGTDPRRHHQLSFGLLFTGTVRLTALGAQQLYTAGSLYRARYIGSSSQSYSTPTGVNYAPIMGLNTNLLDSDQLNAMTTYEQYMGASAQAFIQGLYPPYSINSSAAIFLDPSDLLANNTYIEGPLNGYQYSQIQAVSDFDPNSVYISGNSNCPMYDNSTAGYYSSDKFKQTNATYNEMYREVGNATLRGVIPSGAWSFMYAVDIYDYLAYQYVHDLATRTTLDSMRFANAPVLDQLRWLADQQAFDLNGNYTVDGMVRTISGQTTAAKILGLLETNMATNGYENKLNLLFGSYEPFLSFFALSGLSTFQGNSAFMGLPAYGSSMIFELFSRDSNTNGSYPSQDKLWVRFLFRNGTDANSSLISYPLFHRGPSESDMLWSDFQMEMSKFMLSSVDSWCKICGSESIFCAGFDLDNTNTTSATNAGMSNNVAGVVGAAATLGAILLLFIIAMLLGGLRFHRVPSKKTALGGFKGSAKLASDADLAAAVPKQTISKGGVTDVDVKEEPSSPQRERVGSWEMKDVEEGRFSGMTVISGGDVKRKSSYEEDEDDIAVSPTATPVKPRESV